MYDVQQTLKFKKTPTTLESNPTFLFILFKIWS